MYLPSGYITANFLHIAFSFKFPHNYRHFPTHITKLMINYKYITFISKVFLFKFSIC